MLNLNDLNFGLLLRLIYEIAESLKGELRFESLMNDD